METIKQLEEKIEKRDKILDSCPITTQKFRFAMREKEGFMSALKQTKEIIKIIEEMDKIEPPMWAFISQVINGKEEYYVNINELKKELINKIKGEKEDE